MMRAATRRIGSLYDDALAPFGINIAQYSLLRRIQRLQPVSFTQLGHEVDLDRSTVSRNVRVLEKAGLAVTAKGIADHRESVVSLSGQGEKTLADTLSAWEKCQETMEARLGPDHLKVLREIVRSI